MDEFDEANSCAFTGPFLRFVFRVKSILLRSAATKVCQHVQPHTNHPSHITRSKESLDSGRNAHSEAFVYFSLILEE
jgi:hypothetical protein